MGTTISVNKPTWADTSTVSSCGGIDLEDALSPCCLSPTVPDLCCLARMPWHLPNTIAPSCLERWQQCGTICKEFWFWRSARRKFGFQQLDGTSLGHIYSCVRQENKPATFALHNLYKVTHRRIKCCFALWHWYIYSVSHTRICCLFSYISNISSFIKHQYY